MIIYTDELGAIVFLWAHMLLKNYLFLRAYRYLDKIQKAKNLLMSITWLLHHSCFTVLFYFRDSYSTIQNQTEQNLIIWASILCILTILLGGCIQLIISIVEIVQLLIEGIKQIKQLCRQKQNKQQQIVPIEKNIQKNVEQQNDSTSKKPQAERRQNQEAKIIFDIQILEQSPQESGNQQQFKHEQNNLVQIIIPNIKGISQIRNQSLGMKKEGNIKRSKQPNYLVHQYNNKNQYHQALQI